jgi:diaminohydroxyphosphoribosylaminopyrimidine deaminase/5-amino-6-(5-phosphoribosylamino)uracil reductase
MQPTHEHYMRRCLELAQLGKGKVAPNPLVGCVIVCDHKIVGEGWHQEYGRAHAEVNAINNVADKSILAQSTVYVSLEPCAHFGKTPPCADLLIKHGVANVVVGMVDPYSEVAGKGIAKLEAAGISVKVGVLETECKELNKRFIVFNEQKRPYVLLKWAQTQDGFIAPAAQSVSAREYNEQRHITGKTVQTLVHKWRGEEGAIMVGNNTLLLDNPRLDTRAYPGKNPVRVIIDDRGCLPDTLNVFDGSQPTLVFTSQYSKRSPNQQTEFVSIDFTDSVWGQVFAELFIRKIQSIIIEGGLLTLQSIIASGLWDEMQVFTAPKLLHSGVKAPLVKGELTESFRIGGSDFKRYRNI